MYDVNVDNFIAATDESSLLVIKNKNEITDKDYVSVKNTNEVLDIMKEKIDEKTIEEIDVADDIPVIKVEDKNYIGILEVPTLEITLPIMNEWNNTNSKLSI